MTMRERPILFSAPMIRAILAGKKTQTRRIVKAPKVASLHGRHSVPERHFFDRGFGDGPYVHWFYGGGDLGDDAQSVRVWCPYGKVGDRLWVRETFAAPWGRDGDTYYRADGPDRHDDGSWKPSIHMPRWASRITLEITGVRAERLHAITKDDAIAEGSPCWVCGNTVTRSGFSDCACYSGGDAVLSYETLWREINGAESWAANPLVWVVEFKRVTP